MIDYIAVLERYHPDLGISCTNGTMYSMINWNDETPIAQATLDDEWLDLYKENHIIALSADAEADIIDGFASNVLGGSPLPDYVYDSGPEDQLNLLGSHAAGDDTYYAVRIDGVKSYELHTNAQLEQVIQDGRDVKLGILQTFNIKKAQVLASTTEAEVNAIIW